MGKLPGKIRGWELGPAMQILGLGWCRSQGRESRDTCNDMQLRLDVWASGIEDVCECDGVGRAVREFA